jgi:glutathionylspermidine synthase
MSGDKSASPTRKVNLAQDMLREYHALLRRSPVRARETSEALVQSLRKRGFRIDGANLRATPAPFLLTATEVRGLTRDVRMISNLLEQVVELSLNSVTFMEQLGVPPNVEELALHDTPSRLAIEFARYDYIPGPGGPRFIEFNVDSPAGSTFSNILDTEFQKFDLAREAGMHTLFPSAPPVDLYVDALLAAFSEHTHATVETPNVAVVDFNGTNTVPEQELLVQALRERGLVAALVDPREFEYRTTDRGLYHNDTRYHLVCRRALVPELARRRVLTGPFLRALRHGEVVAINPMRSRLAGNKGVLEVLTSQAFDRFFTPVENQAKTRLLPWTRLLVERRTDYLGRDVDLIPFVASKPEKFVLKPGAASGGQDVVLGAFCSQDEWLRSVDETLNHGGVVQEYVPAHKHPTPLVEGSEIVEQERYLTMGAFAIRGEYAGCIARVSEDPVVNVRRGGGIVPVLELGGRSKTGPIEAARPRRRRTTGQRDRS